MSLYNENKLRLSLFHTNKHVHYVEIISLTQCYSLLKILFSVSQMSDTGMFDGEWEIIIGLVKFLFRKRISPLKYQGFAHCININDLHFLAQTLWTAIRRKEIKIKNTVRSL